MRLDLLLATLFLLAGDAGSGAMADMGSPPSEAPSFDGRDRAVIARDKVLTAIVARDPWLVRRILDLSAPARSGNAPVSPEQDLTQPRDAASSVEWMVLLKRARAERDALRRPAAGQNRSAEGAVDIIDLMKRAKQLKAKE